ncbi:MAG: hypothetical protein ABR613_06755 [Actinomycetota bacterium]
MEEDLRSLKQQVSVLSVVEDPAVRKKIQDTFSDEPRNVIIYRGIERGMTQTQIAAALKERGLPRAQQPRVSETLDELVDRGFVRRAPKGRYVLRDEKAYSDFGLEKVLKRALKKHGVDDLG